MTQADFSATYDTNDRYIELVAQLNARETAIRSHHSGSSAHSDPEPFEFWADTGDSLFRQRAGDSDTDFLALWKLASTPWSSIPYTMSATGTAPSATSTGSGAGATRIIVDGLSATTVITLPSPSGTSDQHRLIVVERRDTSSNICSVGGGTADLEPLGLSSFSLNLYPGDVIGFVATSGSAYAIAFEDRNPVWESTASGAEYQMKWWEMAGTVLINSNENHRLPAPAEMRRYRASFVNNRSSGAATIVPSSGTIDGASSLSLASQYDSAQIITDGTDYFRVA